MGEIIKVSVDKLEFWLQNYRFRSVSSQKEAREKLATTRHFGDLVASIRKHGFQCNNLLTVSEDEEKPGFYLVCDGNRRLAAVQTIPEIKELQVFKENKPEAIAAILAREHTNSPAGRLKWLQVQQARWEESLFRQKISDYTTKVQCLNLLEDSLGENLPSDFYLSTFMRLYESEGFQERLGISVNDDSVTCDKEEHIREIIRDIEDGKLNSRIINTKERSDTYLVRLLAGKDQDERTRLTEGAIEDSEAEEEAEEEEPSRLFRPSDLDRLEKHIKNKKPISELRNVSIKTYPHLLALATRAVLDTLRNINKSETIAPKSLSSQKSSQYFGEEDKRIGKVRAMVESLGQCAHDLRKERTPSDIRNNREILEALVDAMCGAIEENKRNKA